MEYDHGFLFDGSQRTNTVLVEAIGITAELDYDTKPGTYIVNVKNNTNENFTNDELGLEITYEWYNKTTKLTETSNEFVRPESATNKDKYSCMVTVRSGGNILFRKNIKVTIVVFLCPEAVTIDGTAYAQGDDNDDEEWGYTPTQPMKTWKGAYSKLSKTGTWDENVIVLMGTSHADVTNSQYTGFNITSNNRGKSMLKLDEWTKVKSESPLFRNATITGDWDGTDYKGTIEISGAEKGLPIWGDTRFEYITFNNDPVTNNGGDFRQATYRAVRQGLKKAKSVLLEPYYEFRLEIPGDMIGRAMTDIQKMNGIFQQPEADEDDMMVLKGSAPVSMMRDYQTQVTSYTKGRGRLFCSLKGYAPCQNQDEIVEEIGYDSERDLDNPTGSVFCAHGAGFVVPWYEVEDYMHLEGIDESELGDTIPDSEESIAGNRNGRNQGNSGYCPPKNAGVGSYEDEEELKAIFERTFGPVKRYKEPQFKRTFSAKSDSGSYYRNSSSAKKKEKEYLLVDGYNIIYAWEDLKELADANLHAAQTKLMDILSNYQGFKKCTLILVFDAYKIEGHAEEVITYHNIHVVYTKEAETADQYIEKTVHKIGRENQVTVATSDGLEQIIIMGQGAHRMSARGLRDEIKATENQIRQQWHEKRQSSKNYLIDNISDEMAQYMKEKRLGKQ